MIGSVSVEEYTKQHRRRLQEITAATEREKNLLRQRQTDGSPAKAMNSSFNDNATPRATSRSRGLSPHNRTLDTSPHIDASTSRLLQRTVDVTDASNADELAERERLRLMEESLRERERTLLAKEVEVQGKVEQNGRRRRVAEERKRELLSSLQSLAHREEDLGAREETLRAREAKLKTEGNEVRDRQRELNHQESIVSAEHAERESHLNLAKKKGADRKAEDDRVVARLQQQLYEMEDRLRGREMQLMVKQRSLEDAEREVSRAEMRFADSQLRAIEALKRDIDTRVVAAGDPPHLRPSLS